MAVQELEAVHQPRPIRFLRCERAGAWRLKLYGIALPGREARGELVEAAMELASSVFPSPARDEGRYGVGYVTVHDSATFAHVDDPRVEVHDLPDLPPRQLVAMWHRDRHLGATTRAFLDAAEAVCSGWAT